MKRGQTGLMFLAITSCQPPNYTVPPDYYFLSQKPELSLDNFVDEEEAETTSETQEELVKINVKTYFETLSPEYRALLETISWAEYTLKPCLEGISPYQVLVTGTVIEDRYNRYGGKFERCPGNYFLGFADHPRIKIRWHHRARASTAAGKLQWLEQTYDGLRNLKECGLTKTEDCGLFADFTPDEQDRAGVFVIRDQKGVTPEILEKAIHTGNFKPVWKRLAKTWASLPYYDWKGRAVGYYRRQRNARSFDSLKKKYMEKYEFYKSKHE